MTKLEQKLPLLIPKWIPKYDNKQKNCLYPINKVSFFFACPHTRATPSRDASLLQHIRQKRLTTLYSRCLRRWKSILGAFQRRPHIGRCSSSIGTVFAICKWNAAITWFASFESALDTPSPVFLANGTVWGTHGNTLAKCMEICRKHTHTHACKPTDRTRGLNEGLRRCSLQFCTRRGDSGGRHSRATHITHTKMDCSCRCVFVAKGCVKCFTPFLHSSPERSKAYCTMSALGWDECLWLSARSLKAAAASACRVDSRNRSKR